MTRKDFYIFIVVFFVGMISTELFMLKLHFSEIAASENHEVIDLDTPATEFGEFLGTIKGHKITRFETPTAVCFTNDGGISCVKGQ